MKTELDKNTREALITYRLEKSDETLREVDFLISGGFYSGAVSRLYYACYYAAIRDVRPKAAQFIQAVRQLI